MKILEWLRDVSQELKSAGIETGRLDALILLSNVLGKDKSWILAYSDHVLQRSELEVLNKFIAQRLKHIPLAYIRGKCEFYGREFQITEKVLVPRPESESIIDLLLKNTPADYVGTILDIGTGSGCLAITAKLERPSAKVIATDIDPNALAVAKINAHALNANIEFITSDLLDFINPSALNLPPSTILANLPYVPTSYIINKAAEHEPSLALYSGQDGLDHFRQLFKQLYDMKDKSVTIITESLTFQHDSLESIASISGFVLSATDGLAQLFIRKS